MILKVEYNLRSKELGDAQRARKSKIYLKERDTAIRNRLTVSLLIIGKRMTLDFVACSLRFGVLRCGGEGCTRFSGENGK